MIVGIVLIAAALFLIRERNWRSLTAGIGVTVTAVDAARIILVRAGIAPGAVFVIAVLLLHRWKAIAKRKEERTQY